MGTEVVGALAIETMGDHVQIEHLLVLPELQNKGIGSLVVRGILEQAAVRGKPVRLKVLSSNRAKLLFERLGFNVTQQTRERFMMEYPAPRLQ